MNGPQSALELTFTPCGHVGRFLWWTWACGRLSSEWSRDYGYRCTKHRTV